MTVKVFKTIDVSDEEFKQVIIGMVSSEKLSDEYDLLHFDAQYETCLPSHIKSAKDMQKILPSQVSHVIIVDAYTLFSGKVLIYAPWVANGFYSDGGARDISDLPLPDPKSVAEYQYEYEGVHEHAWIRDGLFRFPSSEVLMNEVLIWTRGVFHYVDEAFPLPDDFKSHWSY